MPKNHKIGVFDSGIGGLSVARAVERAFQDAEVLFRHDSPEHFPYACKNPNEIFGYVLPIIQGMSEEDCDVIVVACNTVSTTLIGRLREAIAVPLIAVEPMIKPAAQITKSKVIAVCATPTTLASSRYHALKQQFAEHITIIEPDCADWSQLIERSEMKAERLHQSIDPALERGADVIVLGCTHYHWIEDEVNEIAEGRARVIQPEEAIIDRLRTVLELPG